MKIEQIELRHVVMPLVHPFETSFGREEVRDTIIVCVRGGGLAGWGEAATSTGPWYEYETVQTCWHVLEDFLGPMLTGHELPDASVAADLMAPVRGHNIAKMGLEAAVWDLLAQAEGVTVSSLLGGARENVAVGVSVGVQGSVPELLERIDTFANQGYTRVKIKIRPGWDVDVVRSIRERFPDLPLMVDANSAYTLADIDRLCSLDPFDLMMIEQPLAHDDLVDHAELQRRLRTPVCLDESVPSLAAARAALELGSGRIINIKPGRVGGLVAASAIHELCVERGIPVWCGGMLETGVGRAHNVALASLPGFTLPGDISASSRYFDEDIVEPPFEVNADGTMSVPTEPGIGVQVALKRLERATVRKTSVV
ncbi:o-succinylbenzoate synthase [Chloroflexota bacterium]